MPSLWHGVVELVIETLAGAVVILIAVLIARRARYRAASYGSIVAVVLAGLLAVSVALHLRSAGSALAQAGRDHVSAQLGLEHCVFESLSGLPFAPKAVGYLAWVRYELPPDARYAIAPYSHEPDAWCVTTVLLPALPAAAGERVGWTLALGSIPAEMQAKIARHDPDVQVYAPGYALERDRP